MSTGDTTRHSERQRGRAARAAFIGTFLEYYDLVLYATAAATVFAQVFFPNSTPGLAALQAIATFSIAFLVRPVAGAMLGSLGDRIGRQRVLVGSLLVMGLATIGIGLTPSFDAIGWAAPAILVFLRLLQGVGASAEYTGATVVAVEFAPAKRRGLMGAIVPMGAGLGGMTSSLALLFFSSIMSQDDFLSWGWRIPFLLSVVVLAYGLYLRTHLPETPEFDGARAAGKISKRPLRDVLRTHRRAVATITLVFIAVGGCANFFVVFMVSFGTNQAALPQSSVFLALVLAQLFGAIFSLVFGWLSDLTNRRAVVASSFVMYILIAFPTFWLALQGTGGFIVLMILGGSLAFGLSTGPLGAFSAALLPEKLRFSALGFSREVGITIGGGLVPLIAVPLAFGLGGTWQLSLMLIAIATLGLAGALLVPPPARPEEAASAEGALALERELGAGVPDRRE